jgi:hypothetical protein
MAHQVRETLPHNVSITGIPGEPHIKKSRDDIAVIPAVLLFGGLAILVTKINVTLDP